ncbi:cytochrome c [Geminocystis sp. GBBB08]|uniref:cytochrome c n=1 Tax=Geminocystis sp. GBBB08 TaxID=2604140 RepID=UPI0027E3722E|nr:cytochrome c [Geminocystis sp. GBBB08]MBL1209670.1 cytochrome c [Geminocystis sp. GBBB08]
MNNQLLEKDLNYTNIKNTTISLLTVIIILTLVIIAWWLIPTKNPYIQKVFSFQGNIERGNAIFQVNCAGCHGINGNGNVGPSLKDVSKHKSEVQIINQVIGGKTPPMPKFQPSPEDMADLLSYLRQLS